MIRKRYPLLARLARVDRELGQAAQMLDLMGDDVREAMLGAQDAEHRTQLLTAVSGMLLLCAGIAPSLVATWLIAMQPMADPEEAERLTTHVIDQLGLLHGTAAGQA